MLRRNCGEAATGTKPLDVDPLAKIVRDMRSKSSNKDFLLY